MKLKVVLRHESGGTSDVVVTADSTATVGDVARTFLHDDPHLSLAPWATDDVTLSVASPDGRQHVVLDPDSPIGEAALGSGFDVSIVDAATRSDETAAAVLTILNGPDAGRSVMLPEGSGTIGRDSSATVTLNDPMVSKKHARIEISPAGIEIVDLNSANGILVDGGVVPRLRMMEGRRATLGDTVISVTPLNDSAAGERTIIERGGFLAYNRSPRVELRYVGTEMPPPEVPSEKEERPFPWIMMIAPVLMGGFMYAMTRNPLSLGFIAMAPMMMIGNFLMQSSRTSKKQKKEIFNFELQLEALEDHFIAEEPEERQTRLRESPSVAEIFDEAQQLGPMLWTRRPEHWNFLDVRLGIGEMPRRLTIGELEKVGGIEDYRVRLDALNARYEKIAHVPVVENPHVAGALGVCGETGAVCDTVRALGVQFAGLHSPSEVTFAALTSTGIASEFEWLKWMPHTTSPHNPLGDFPLADNPATGIELLNALEGLVAARLAKMRNDDNARGAHSDEASAAHRGTRVGDDNLTSDFEPETPVLIIYIDNDVDVDRARLVQLIERAADARIYAVWMAPTIEALPAACRTVVDVSSGLDHAQVSFVRQGITVDDVDVEGVSQHYATTLARRLAPVVDAGAVIADSSDLPRSVSLLSLTGTELADDPKAALERWSQNASIIDRSGGAPVRRKRAGTLRALIGQGSPDAMHLDLRVQGPHALVGGTTGSGKSEFLQAWVLGMAAEYSPDRVTFLFVDYKGGSAFAECVNLPHCVGLVTDLSPHLVRRALTSLRAELHYREHVLNRKKAKDLLELEKRGDPECPPALVLVIDEFAALAGEVPEFVDGVVDIAQRGRSLGIHLIMATQRPAGVIKDNLRANTNLRVALRMADESDSKDVVGDPIAGTFDPTIPGRGIAKTGPGRLIPFQSGYAGGWTSDEPEQSAVDVAEFHFGTLTPWESEVESDVHEEEKDLGPNDQSRMVATFVAAAKDAQIPEPRRPWLDDLPETYDLAELDHRSDEAIVMGVSDRPEKQAQEPSCFYPDRDGHMAVYGTGGTGKTALLRTLAISSVLGDQGGPVHVYGMDFGTGALRSIESLPHVGSVVPGDDYERVSRLLKTLRSELNRRSEEYSNVNAGSIAEYRELAGAPGEPRILLLLDGFGGFRSEYETTLARAPLYNAFVRLLGEGRPLGMHVVLTADRSGSVPSAVTAAIQRRTVLRLPDPASYQLLGAPKDVLDENSPPGRAVVDGYETQLAVIGGTANVSEQTRATEALAAELAERGVSPAPEVGALPKEAPIDDMPEAVNDLPVVGISEETLDPCGFEPIGTFLIGGPPRSGKTNTLRALSRTIKAWDPNAKFFHIAGRRAKLADDMEWTRSAVRMDDVVELVKELSEIVSDEEITDKLVIVVESVTQFSGSAADKPLADLAKKINRSDHVLITEADVANLSSGIGLIGEMKAGRAGIILKPDTHDGDTIFKAPFPRVARHESPEGRGFMVQNGQVLRVQVPLVEP
ncbi:FtsK/SpoIIIE domain-containing protein [Paramicrobacterium agarici]|uniref:FtsK/SpoIIIE domain-containing protein n=1 Tax=Paramicrobacterium agarici TaxID=630514 RepID=UPI00114FBC39|nr:FtsK/SpoIIIE domain-containing protein [Microbacterium agarici]TQO23357.1 S-DNA-T family DNA segregation ATPase FtsK/SpoIIIE [Microbacterium agarici]